MPQLKEQSYAFDAFGNIQSITTNGTTVATPTQSATNRLDVPSAYDGAGDLTSWQGNTYEYDALNMIRCYRTAAGLEWAYIYNADDERVWTYKTGGTESRWFLRGFDAKVLRKYTASSAWQVANDYVYRDGQLLATETPAGLRHYHLDHLGTPRLITDVNGVKTAFHAYYPFGQEATIVSQDSERIKFTGHERDLGDPASAADDLDYMHARFFGPMTGRFLSVDHQLGRTALPQTWNRYGYVAENPLKYVDLNGLELQAFYLATGTTWDFARHSAIYFRDDSPSSPTDVVFSHGGMADGVSTPDGYLSHYDKNIDPTVAYPLNLPPGQAHRLFDAFKSDWTLSRANFLIYTGDPYDETSNNCAQHVCNNVLSKVEWDPVRGVMIEVFTIVDKVTPGPAFLSTNQAVNLLRGLGILGEARDELRPPGGALRNVIYYWSYHPKGKN